MPIETNVDRLEILKDMVGAIDGDFTAQTFGFEMDGQAIVEELKWLIERVQELEVTAEGYRSNWYKCVNDKTGSNQELKITPKGSVNAPWG